MDPPRGLTWVQNTFGLEPRWSVEPDREAIKQTLQSLKPASTIQVTFIAQGALNKLYDIQIDGEVFIIRISLPVDPYYKTVSEVSTLEWISRTLKIPVPRVITYQSSRENPIGFEWILMTKMPGRPLREKWRYLSFPQKERLVEGFAAYSSSVFQHQFRGIGNIYKVESAAEAAWPAGNPTYSNKSSQAERDISHIGLPDVGRIVSMHFFWGSRLLQRDVPRGPFSSSRDWISSRLSISERECQSVLDNLPSGDLSRTSDDEDEADDATRTLGIIDKLKQLLPSIFPLAPDGSNPEPTTLFHDDLSRGNILVDDNGELSAVLDWECVSVLPLACCFPAFLEERTRSIKPDLGRYEPETNGEPSELYWEHLWEYELTLLRGVFIDRMKRLDPKWMKIFDGSQRQRDFDFAVHNCDNEFLARHILAWVEDLKSGIENPRSLQDRIYGD